MKSLLKFFLFVCLVGFGFTSSIAVFADDSDDEATSNLTDREESIIESCKAECGEDENCKTACENRKCLELNTSLPIIGRFICNDDRETIFPNMMTNLTTIILTLGFVAGIIVLIGGGVLMASSGGSQARFDKGKDLVLKVLFAIALLGLAGVILHILNPNFFQ